MNLPPEVVTSLRRTVGWIRRRIERQQKRRAFVPDLGQANLDELRIKELDELDAWLASEEAAQRGEHQR